MQCTYCSNCFILRHTNTSYKQGVIPSVYGDDFLKGTEFFVKRQHLCNTFLRRHHSNHAWWFLTHICCVGYAMHFSSGEVRLFSFFTRKQDLYENANLLSHHCCGMLCAMLGTHCVVTKLPLKSPLLSKPQKKHGDPCINHLFTEARVTSNISLQPPMIFRDFQ